MANIELAFLLIEKSIFVPELFGVYGEPVVLRNRIPGGHTTPMHSNAPKDFAFGAHWWLM